MFAISVYLSVGVPACRTIANPIEGVDTREDQIEALRILSAGNTIIIVLLGAVLALQVRSVVYAAFRYETDPSHWLVGWRGIRPTR